MVQHQYDKDFENNTIPKMLHNTICTAKGYIGSLLIHHYLLQAQQRGCERCFQSSMKSPIAKVSFTSIAVM